MRSYRFSALMLFLFAMPASGQQSPSESSCEILDLIGQNRSGEVRNVMQPKTATWIPGSREALIERLEELILETGFSGGTVYHVGRLGNNFEEHLMILRLAQGEIAGTRLSYQWTPSGLSLTNLDFKSDLKELMATPFLNDPVEIQCGTGGD